MYRVSRGRRENLAQNDYVVRREYEPKRDIITSSFFFPPPFEEFFPLSNFRFLPVGNIILLVFSPRFPSLFSLFFIANSMQSTIINYYQLLSYRFWFCFCSQDEKIDTDVIVAIKRSAGNSFVTERLRNGSIIVERTF